jgi:hypothetical protein
MIYLQIITLLQLYTKSAFHPNLFIQVYFTVFHVKHA